MQESTTSITGKISDEVTLNLSIETKVIDMQGLLSEVTSYVESAEKSEKDVLQKYVDRYIPFFMFAGGSFLLAAVMFSCGPFIMATTLPANAWYPFSIDVFWIRFILYSLQILVIFQSVLNITVNYTIAMMLWYCTARLEILGRKIESAACKYELGLCIEEHQKLIM